MKKIKWFWFIPVFAIMIGLLPAVSVKAAATLTIVTPDEQKLDGGAIIIQKNQLMIPLRQLAQATHSQLQVASNGTVTVAPWPGQVYTLKLGQRDYTFNQARQEIYQLRTPIQKINGQVYIPAAFIRELDYTYTYSKGILTIQMPLSTYNRQILNKGDLATVRKFITTSDLFFWLPGVHSLQQPLKVKPDGERLDRQFLFPEGEALRFYYIYGDTISFIEFKDDFPVITWQAHGLSADRPHEGFSILNDLLTFQLKDKWGDIPLKYHNFTYYLRGGWGDSYLQESGIIQADNIYHQTGRIYNVGGTVTNQSGTISYVSPGEQRTDTR